MALLLQTLAYTFLCECGLHFSCVYRARSRVLTQGNSVSMAEKQTNFKEQLRFYIPSSSAELQFLGVHADSSLFNIAAIASWHYWAPFLCAFLFGRVYFGEMFTQVLCSLFSCHVGLSIWVRYIF